MIGEIDDDDIFNKPYDILGNTSYHYDIYYNVLNEDAMKNYSEWNGEPISFTLHIWKICNDKYHVSFGFFIKDQCGVNTIYGNDVDDLDSCKEELTRIIDTTLPKWNLEINKDCLNETISNEKQSIINSINKIELLSSFKNK